VKVEIGFKNGTTVMHECEFFEVARHPVTGAKSYNWSDENQSTHLAAINADEVLWVKTSGGYKEPTS
jgi:hypothetical protein